MGPEIRPGIILRSHKILSRVRTQRTPTSWAQQCLMETTLALHGPICAENITNIIAKYYLKVQCLDSVAYLSKTHRP